MKKILLYSLCFATILLMLLIAGCSQLPSTQVQPSHTQVVLPSSTATPLPEPTMTSTAIPEANINLNEKCIQTVSQLQTSANGVIVLHGTRSSDLSLTDLAANRTTILGKISPGSEISPIMAVSPDFMRLAYTDEKLHQLIIVDAQGKRLETKAIPADFAGVIQWMDNDNLLLERFIFAPYGEASSVLYNLATGKKTEYGSDYPDMPAFQGAIIEWGNYSFTRAVYDSSFSRVLYPAWDGAHQEHSLVLWDIQNQRQVARWIGYFYEMGAPPQWLKDGSQFIAGISPNFPKWENNTPYPYENFSDGLPYQDGFDLFSISRDGKMQRLTYLTTKYKAAEEGFSLSPDEKQVAFWLNLNFLEGDSRQLAILDMATGAITNLCLAGGDAKIAPIWSPDSHSLAVSVYHDATRSIETFIVDIENNSAFKLGDDIQAEGWMTKQP